MIPAEDPVLRRAHLRRHRPHTKRRPRGHGRPLPESKEQLVGILLLDIVGAHDAIESWINTQGGRLTGAAREVYFPAFGQAADTEIVGEVAYAYELA
ncbi:MAG: hypothetical protein QM753_02205 [Thermomicrobiales bacterium]